LLSAALIACYNPSGGGSQPVVTGVTVSPGTADVVKGGTQTFTATVNGIHNPAQTVTWTVSGGGAGTAITPGGVLTVAAGETAATLTVTATSTQDPGKSGAANVTIPSAHAAFIHAAGWRNSGATMRCIFTATTLTITALGSGQTAVITFGAIIPVTDRVGQPDYQTGFTFNGTISSNTITSGYAWSDASSPVGNKLPGAAHNITWYISNDGQSIISKYEGGGGGYILSNSSTLVKQ
jgi:hypothetical protein